MKSKTDPALQTEKVPAGAELDQWSGLDWKNGVQVDRMLDFECLEVETEEALYEITIICGRTGEVMIHGGKFFPESTPVFLCGSTLGGSFLKIRGIYSGFRMELQHEGYCIITPMVRTIRRIETPQRQISFGL